MDEKTYKITLADETALEGLKLNGNNFISDTVLNPEIFTGNCSPMTINDGEVDDVHEHAELVQCVEMNGKSWMVFRDLTDKELSDRQMRSDLDYLAMMTDTDLG